MTTDHKNLIYISAGESSGDLLGANLAQTLLNKNPQLKLVGMGGTKMKAAGVSIQFNADIFSVVGLSGILFNLPKILITLHKIKKYLKQHKPALIILIDLPDTHLRIAAMAKKLGIPVLYYVSPQIWAWRYARIKQIKENINHMAVLFPFEEKIYQKENVPVTFVGHPLANLVKPTMTQELAYKSFRLDSKSPIVSLLPGSRRGEIARHLPIILEAAKMISQKIPNVQFVLPLADIFNEFEIREKVPSHIKVIKNNLYNLLSISDAAIAVSGTVTLEVALMQVPMCIIYKFGEISFQIAKRLIKVDHIGLCNLISQKKIVKEFIQDQANPQIIADEIIKLLSNQEYSNHIRHELSLVKNQLGISDPSARVAEVALRMI